MSKLVSDPSESSDMITALTLLVSKGDFEGTKKFIKTNERNKDFLINERHMIRYYGNVLHTALYWNKDEKGWEFFNFLVEQGVVFLKDDYFEYPWEQRGVRWIDPLTQEDLGNRYYSDFKDFYEAIKYKVNLMGNNL